MTAVIDFGSVNWNNIWIDRATWVTPEHLRELNGVSTAQKLSNPGYWHNLFASYPEVISQAGAIAHKFTVPGQQEKHFATQLSTPMLRPDAMNNFYEKNRAATITLRDENRKKAAEYLAANPRLNDNAPLASRLLDGAKQVPVIGSIINLTEGVGHVAGKVIATGEKIVDGAAKVADLVDDAAGKVKNIIDNPPTLPPLIDFGMVGMAIAGVGAVILLSSASKQ